MQCTHWSVDMVALTLGLTTIPIDLATCRFARSTPYRCAVRPDESMVHDGAKGPGLCPPFKCPLSSGLPFNTWLLIVPHSSAYQRHWRSVQPFCTAHTFAWKNFNALHVLYNAFQILGVNQGPMWWVGPPFQRPRPSPIPGSQPLLSDPPVFSMLHRHWYTEWEQETETVRLSTNVTCELRYS